MGIVAWIQPAAGTAGALARVHSGLKCHHAETMLFSGSQGQVCGQGRRWRSGLACIA